MTAIVIVTAGGERLGIVDPDVPCRVGTVVGPVPRGWQPGQPPDPEQPSSLSVSGLTLAEVEKLQGKRVAIFELQEG